MIGTDVDVEIASDSRECDYLVDDSRGQTVDVYEAWELEDEENVIVVMEHVDDDLADHVEDETRYELRWAGEVQSATVVERDIEIRERPAFYAEEAPRRIAKSIGHREAIELLERRGREPSAGDMEDAWLFPRIDEVGIHYTATDNAGEQYETYQTIRGLTDEERSIAEGEWPDDGESEMSFSEVAARVHEQSALYERQSHYVAAFLDGADTFADVRDTVNREMDEELSYNDVTASWYKMRDRQQEIAWQIVHVWPHIPDEHRSEEMEMILESVGVEASPSDPEWLDRGD